MVKIRTQGTFGVVRKYDPEEETGSIKLWNCQLPSNGCDGFEMMYVKYLRAARAELGGQNSMTKKPATFMIDVKRLHNFETALLAHIDLDEADAASTPPMSTLHVPVNSCNVNANASPHQHQLTEVLQRTGSVSA